VTPAESLNRTKTRFVAGSKGTVPVAVRKIPNVGVLLVSICTVALPLGAERQIPVEGFVWHTEMATGSVASPVSAEVVMSPPVPTFTVATARAPAWAAPLTVTMPSFIGVVASATISGVGDVDADNNSVLSPVVIDAGLVFEHSKFS
jgi:hypothetical protein